MIDLARERRLTLAAQHRAVRTVCGSPHVADAQGAARLLAALGLDPAMGAGTGQGWPESGARGVSGGSDPPGAHRGAQRAVPRARAGGVR